MSRDAIKNFHYFTFDSNTAFILKSFYICNCWVEVHIKCRKNRNDKLNRYDFFAALWGLNILMYLLHLKVENDFKIFFVEKYKFDFYFD